LTPDKTYGTLNSNTCFSAAHCLL